MGLTVGLVTHGMNKEEKQLADLHGRSIELSQFIDTANRFTSPQREYNLIVYIDSNDCFSCILDQNAWQLFKKRVYKRTKEDVNISFIISPIYENIIKNIEHNDLFNIYIDTNYKFKNTNKLPNNFMYRTFLLDSLNRITIIGNPLFNSKIEELICKTLCNN